MDILKGIESKIGQCLGEVIIQQARYLFCFNSIVEDLEAEENNLKLKLADIKERVEREERNTKEIEKDVEKWLKDAGNVMADVQRLKAEIQLKESCLIGWCPNWGYRYSLSSKAAEKTSFMLKLQNSADKFRTVAHLKRLPGIEFSAPRDFMPFKATELASDQLIDALKNENTKLVGLYGPGGVGKTTLATVVGHKLQQQQVFDEVVIATVSQNPNILDVQTKLAESLCLELKEVSKEERAKRLYLRFSDPKSKILIILDDVWKQHNLKNEFGIPVDDNLNGCKILLTTRRNHVCGGMGCNPSIALGILEPEEGFALLKCHAGIDDHDSTLIDVSKEVAGECKGLPLAIEAVGKALKGKDVDEWNRVYHKLKTAELDGVDDVDVNVYACLKLSYDYLRDKETKLCFLLCSLFPEDFEIDLEELVRYGVGLGLYQRVETIEKARGQLRGMIRELKDSSLLLDAGKEGFVKMHDIVRDVAIWIGSKEEKFFNRAGTGLTEWPEDEGLEQCRAISLLGNKIKVLPNGLVFPNLHTLLLGNYDKFSRDRFVVPEQLLEGMTALKVATIMGGDLSIEALQFSTNLQVLQLIRCNVRGMAFVGKLKRLQILCLEKSSLDEIPDDLADKICRLKLLDLIDLNGSEVKISLIKRFSQLQEFYGQMTWEVEGANAECLSKDFTFPQLQRYDIDIRKNFPYRRQSETNALRVENIEATSLIIFSALYQNVQYLYLKDIQGCQNILPSIDRRGLNELTFLELKECKDLKYIMDASQHVGPQETTAFSKLRELTLESLPNLTTFCSKYDHSIWPALQKLILINCPRLIIEADANEFVQSLAQNLQYLCVEGCNRLSDAIGTLLKHGLKNLKNLRIGDLGVQVVFQLPDIIVDGQESQLFPSLKSLRLSHLREMEVLYKGPTLIFGLQNLTSLDVKDCHRLRHLLTPTLARNLLQLVELSIHKCLKLEQIIEEDEEEDHLSPVCFPKLRSIRVELCPKLKHLFHISVAPSLQNLSWLRLDRVDKLEEVFWHKDGAVVVDENKIVMTELRNLELQDLPNLTNCLPTGYQITFPSLKSKTVKNCPKLKYENDVENLRYLCLKKVKGCQNILPSIGQRGLNELTSLELSECEDLECIMDASQHVKSQSLVMFSRLATLRLTDLQKLQWIWKAPAQHVDLQNLTEVDVIECNNLTYLFSLSQARSLLQLRSLKVQDCKKLEHIIAAKIDNNERRTNILERDEYIIALLMLKKLTLDSLPKLTSFCSECYFPTWQALDELALLSCPRLTVSADEFVQAKNLKYLIIRDCKDLECIMDASQHVKSQSFVMLSRLATLHLTNLRKLQWIWKAPAHHVDLRNIIEVEVGYCNNLTYIFSLSQVRSLLQLKSLVVSECEKLEHIIEAKIDNIGRRENIVEGDEYTIALPMLEKLKLESLPNLTALSSECYFLTCQALQKLSLINCPRLTCGADEFVQTKNLQYLCLEDIQGCQNILRSIDQRGFYELTTLIIRDCEDLECIMDASQYVGLQKTTAFLKLRELTLHSLPNLTTFYSKYDHSIWPALQRLTLIKCPRLISGTDEFVQNLAKAKHLELRNLTEVEVRDCNSLTYLFSLSQARSLVQLKKLVVSECEKLEHIIEAKIDNNGRRENIVEGDEYTIALPMLEELTLVSIPNLTTLISCPHLTGRADEFVQAENLQYLYLKKIKGCQNILRSIYQGGFYELTTLIVRDCEDIECILDGSQRVGLQKTTVLPKLRELRLESLSNLTTFCSKYDHSIWSALQKLTLINCPQLTSGTDEFVQNLTEAENLQYLYLEKVKGCQNILRSIDQRGFYKLTTLTIRDCEDIECILDASQCVGLQKTAALPKLRELTLESLPNLTTFYSKCDHSIWPALQKLTLINCPRLTSSIDEFVQNLAENLQFLRVERCYHLCDAIVALLKHGLKNLKDLYIGDLGAQVGFQLSDIIVDGQESILFPSLKWLGLYGLREIEVLYKGPTHFFCNLRNLTRLDVRDCNQLRHLLTPTLA